MAQSFIVQFEGSAKLRQKLQALQQATPLILATAVREEAEVLMADIKENHVPKRDSILAASGYVKDAVVTAARSVRVILGFGGASAPYAWATHENPRAGKTDGVSPSGRRYKKWAKVGHYKYLEQPLFAFAHGLPQRVFKRVNDKWHAVIGGKA